jgi:hypothetical protein
MDWSEKLRLAPNHEVNCGTYAAVGVLVIVAIYRGRAGQVVETHVPMYETDVNDVPHTHAGLRRVLAHYATQSAAIGAILARVDVWSDGGPKHFKVAENLFFCSHLQEHLRVLTDFPTATLLWNFMCPNHGKGPYDAEGGLFKYYVRREMKFQHHAFATVGEVVVFLKGCSALMNASAELRPGHRQLKQYTITVTLPHYL